MPITAENKLTVIIARMPEFRGWKQDEIERQLIRWEVTPTIFDNPLLSPSAWVVGNSLREIYEKVLGRECGYGGSYAEAYIEYELTKIHKVVPILVKNDVLQKILQIKEESKVNAALQRLTSLPPELAIEKS
ncbi:hypothetical protein A2363_04510 [Candidatus Gottesmanbacteria bacterium RIFOXYB1_FULL_47_11]|uniref:Uncharacterized protein n=1 Tax=Candidatus Gottesmanbacteria bacterium RIFOXYB1_FULL_47_11 TaxID=1798401 RepID=A0A1F6BDG7_9BACT|nr:MAG: hypothetical protein A2363_04510 [Candidatus Gottesmanbacteria bacterium RIFOXYB1_FULL_47_11]